MRSFSCSKSPFGENKLGYLSTDVICFEKRTVFHELLSQKTVNFEVR